MSETPSESSKYNIQISLAQGPVIGDNAHVEQHFHGAPPPPPPASREELLTAIHQTNSELRNYSNSNEIAGIRLEPVGVLLRKTHHTL